MNTCCTAVNLLHPFSIPRVASSQPYHTFHTDSTSHRRPQVNPSVPPRVYPRVGRRRLRSCRPSNTRAISRAWRSKPLRTRVPPVGIFNHLYFVYQLPRVIPSLYNVCPCVPTRRSRPSHRNSHGHGVPRQLLSASTSSTLQRVASLTDLTAPLAHSQSHAHMGAPRCTLWISMNYSVSLARVIFANVWLCMFPFYIFVLFLFFWFILIQKYVAK